ncbi:MAG: 50S ribosomal protein L39e [Candidatus Marsarchaeota archaeon]|nr:50S ribosomal protein L39e [Candidatus Marsarchaeota archaeon]MCL5094916.1 50S ribosomal protein L39e [Candidatus Marsarchaeota archaeon]
MSKKSNLKKRKLGKKLKQNRRIPLLAILKTHRRVQTNKFSRNWRQNKLKIKEEK